MRHIDICHPTAAYELGELVAPRNDLVTQWH